MVVYITSAYLQNCENYIAKDLSRNTSNSTHIITENPEIADIIIFAEHHPGNDPYFFKILTNPIFLKYRKKCYLYHDNDYSISFLPTISPSIELTHFKPLIHRSSFYLAQLSPNPYIIEQPRLIDKKYLFSFIGTSRTHSIRKKIFAENFREGYLYDTNNLNSWDISGETKKNYFEHYAKISCQSKFILCPRGVSPSSYRLYECLKMGIAPVIISDDWVKVDKVDWDTFSVIIKEKDVKLIESILKEKEKNYKEMGLLAREAWEQNFSDEKKMHFLIETCNILHLNRNKITVLTYVKELFRFGELFHFTNLLRFIKNKFKLTVRFLANEKNYL